MAAFSSLALSFDVRRSRFNETLSILSLAADFCLLSAKALFSVAWLSFWSIWSWVMLVDLRFPASSLSFIAGAGEAKSVLLSWTSKKIGV